MAKLDDIELWKERIRWGRKWQSSLTRPQRWRQARRWYRNDYGPGVIAVNLPFAIGRKLVIDLYFKNPIILVKPEHPSTYANARVMEAISGDLMRVMNYKQQTKNCILDAFLTNIGVMKFGYHSWSTLTPASGGAKRTPGGNAIGQLMELMSEVFGSASATGGGVVEDPNYSLYNYHDDIKPNAPWAMHWPTEDVIFPWGTRTLQEMPWIAFRFKRSKFAMDHDPAYENTKAIKGCYHSKEGDLSEGLLSPKDREFSLQSPEEVIVGYEIWDRQTKRCRVLVMDHDKWLRNEDPNLGNEGLPVEFLQFNPTNEDCFGVSDVEEIEKQVLEYNETRTIEMYHKKMALTRIAYNRNKIKPTDIEKLNKGEIMVAIPCDDAPDNVLKYFVPPMSSDLFRVGDEIRRDIAELMNFSRNQGGAAESPRKSASEAMIIKQAIEQRADERRDQVGDFIEAAYKRQLHPIVWTNWSEERYTAVSGVPGFTKYIGTDLKGDYGVSVHADSRMPLSSAERKQDIRELYAIMVADPLFAAMPPQYQFRLREQLLERHEGINPHELMPTWEEFLQFQQQQVAAAKANPEAGSQAGEGEKNGRP